MRNKILTEGFVAWHADINDNPYEYNTEKAELWDEGWLAAEKEES